MDAPVVDMSGQVLRRQPLPAGLFDIEPNRVVMHQALVRQLAGARLGTHKVQTRSEVKRTSKKWYRQKGTGRARHGERTANLFVGGFKAHGPRPRRYELRMPRAMRRLALRSALSAKAADDAIVLLEGWDLEAPRTRAIRDLVDTACGGASALVLLAEGHDAVERSIRNLPHVRYLRAGYLNIRDLLGYDRLIIPLDALAAITAHLGGVVEGDEGDESL
jgi:large subunit ribosomal protein L4